MSEKPSTKMMVNPYARKKPKTTPSVSATTTQPPRTQPAASSSTTTGLSRPRRELLPDNMTVPFSSFSQAFSSVDDYVEDYASAAKSGTPATISTTTTTNTTASLLSDQDNNNNINSNNGKDGTTSPNTRRLTDREMQAVGTAAHDHVLYISPKQQGNLVLQYIRNVPTQFIRMLPDYLFSPTQCALFLSLKYHKVNKSYLQLRMDQIKMDFVLRILLVLVDVQDNAQVLRDLQHRAIVQKWTLVLAWTAEEAGRYLETFQAMHNTHHHTSLIQKPKSANQFGDQVTHVLTACPALNKTDAANLLGHFGSMQALFAKATPEELALVPGLGQVKVARLYEALCKPFTNRKRKKTKKGKQAQLQNPATKNEQDDSTKDDVATDKKNKTLKGAKDEPIAVKEPSPTLVVIDSP